MTKYASFPMALDHLTEDHEWGWTPWGLDHEKILNAAKKLNQAEWGGIRLDRCCGALGGPRYHSHDTQGTPIQVWPAGPNDNPYPLDLAVKLKGMGFRVMLFGGWPLDTTGFKAIETATELGLEVGVDSSGGATNGHLITRFGGTPEPMPLPHKTPGWFDANCTPIMMAGRADKLLQLGVMPKRAHVVLNGGEDGHSYYTVKRARKYLGLGHHVHVPPIGWLQSGGPA